MRQTPQIDCEARGQALGASTTSEEGPGSTPVGGDVGNFRPAPQPANWHVVSVNSKFEIETAARINSAGFVAHCPVFQKKYTIVRRGRHFLRSKIEPLFQSYLFVRENAAFRIEKFETSKARLFFIRTPGSSGMISDAQMAVINSTALDLTMAQQRSTSPLKIKVGDLMQILHGAMQGEPVDALELRKDQVRIGWRERPTWRPVWINASSLAKVV